MSSAHLLTRISAPVEDALSLNGVVELGAGQAQGYASIIHTTISHTWRLCKDYLLIWTEYCVLSI